jgi:hypothetical protein
MQYQCQLAIHPTQPSPTQLSLREAQRRGNPPPNCLCEKRSDVAILHPTVFARSAATWQSFTQLSLRGAQRRGNPSPNCLCEELSDVAIYRYRLDCFTPFAMTGKRSVREDKCIPRTPTQLSLREAQRRGNPSPNCLCEKRSDVAILHPTVFARSSATWQSIGIAWIASLRSQ